MSRSSTTAVCAAAVTLAAALATAAAVRRLRRRLAAAEKSLRAMETSAAFLPPMPVLPITSDATLRCCRELRLRDTDVFVCSYPKSGTTWMQAIVVNLLTQGASPGAGEHISAFAPFFDVDRTWNHASGEPSGVYTKGGESSGGFGGGRRVFNTHLRWDQMPRDEGSGARYIYVVRDGKDVVTSFFHHLSNQADSGGFGGTFEEFFAAWLGGSTPYGRWADHVKSWLLRSPSSVAAGHVLVVYYEDLLADLEGQVRRVDAFLRRDLRREDPGHGGSGGSDGAAPSSSSSSSGDGAERRKEEEEAGRERCLAKVLEQVSFAFMKQHIERYQPLSVGWKPGYQFIRKGTAGDYKALLTPEQVQRYRSALRQSFPADVLSFKPGFLVG